MRTRHQEYKYQYKTIAVTNAAFCGNGPRLRMSVPDDMLDVKALYMHAVLQFNSGVTSGNRVVHWIGGIYEQGLDGIPHPTDETMMHVNKQADLTTRIVDVKADLTQFKDSVSFEDAFSFDQPDIEVNILTSLSGDAGAVTGTVILWKVDLIYTTSGIQ